MVELQICRVGETTILNYFKNNVSLRNQSISHSLKQIHEQFVVTFIVKANRNAGVLFVNGFT